MKKLSYHELRGMWFDFLREKGHSVIPSASVVPENDGTTLFVPAGMQPLVPFLLGSAHPAGKRLANIQKCVRTNDIDEVGDATHLTFFEMMGNWALGDTDGGYFKREKIAWSFEFLTSPKYLGIPKDLISVTCFEGDQIAPKDMECAKLWEEQGIPRERIWFLPKSENWWQLPAGVGPCGPCSEMFVDTGKPNCGKDCNPSCNCGKYIEVGNDVYMQYIVKTPGGVAEPASQKNVDTGWGLERILCFSQGLKSVYDSELFVPAIELITSCTDVSQNMRATHILAEHTRAATVIIGDGVLPSNTGAGYVLRRLIRRAVRQTKILGISCNIFEKLIDIFIGILGCIYDNLNTGRDNIVKVFMDEVAKFEKTLEQGIREFEKVVSFLNSKELSGKTAFRLFETYGFPIELTEELARERGLSVNMAEYSEAKDKHAKLSQTANAGEFRGGLADSGETTARLHTATHILLAVLREMFGAGVMQKGSNINPERLRFDFNLDHKLEDTEIAEIEKRVNNIIAKKLPVTIREMPIEEARKIGAVGSFGDKYGDIVKVYTIADSGLVVSCEICGGPHAGNTGELGYFKILKEESVAAGVRRVKAILQTSTK